MMSDDSENLPGMKEDELRKHCTCRICKRKIGQIGFPCIWKAHLERHVLDPGAIKRHAGLEAMVGSAMIASVMSPNEDMTKCMASMDVMICDECILERLPELLESET